MGLCTEALSQTAGTFEICSLEQNTFSWIRIWLSQMRAQLF